MHVLLHWSCPISKIRITFFDEVLPPYKIVKISKLYDFQIICLDTNQDNQTVPLAWHIGKC